jgi:hypothetical protein
LIADIGLSVSSSLRGAKRRSNPARAKRANKKRGVSGVFSYFFGAPAGAQLDCFASLAMTQQMAARLTRP